MFGALASKALTSIMAFGMMIFTSTEGNKAEFSSLQAQYLNDGLVIQTSLVNSFEHDFQQVFKSGKPIIIDFELELHQGNNLLHKENFTHTVTYDPMQQNFKIELQEQEDIILEDSYSAMLEQVSQIKYQYWGEMDNKPVKVKLQGSLRKLHLASEKDYNLMILWKYRKPTIDQEIGYNKNEF